MDVTRAIRRIHLHTAHGDEDCTQLGEEIAALLRGLPELDGRAVIRHAYWRMPDVPTDALEIAVSTIGRLTQLAGRGPVIGGCRQCGRVLRARHRDELEEEAPARCRECEASRSTADPVAADAQGAPSAARTDPISPRAIEAFGWEFHAAPEPWRPPAAALRTADRRWAEHYPDTSCA